MKRVIIVRLLMLLVVLQVSFKIAAQPLEFKTVQYDEAAGLSSRSIQCLLQDSRGFLWMGTADGLNRYDGYNFTVFKKKRNDRFSIGSNHITRLAEDRDHTLWVGLYRGGISHYEPANGKFITYPLPVDSGDPYSAPAITMLYTDSSQFVWVGVESRGLARLDKKTGKYTFFDIVAPVDSFYTPERRRLYNHVYAATPDNANGLWLATHDGLYHFNKSTAKMQAIREKPVTHAGLRDDLYLNIIQFDNYLWMGSWAGGLACYNLQTNNWQHFLPNPNNAHIPTTNIVSDVKMKNAQEFWVCTTEKGLGTFNRNTKQFSFFAGKSNNLPSKMCFGLLPDSEGNIWLSYEKGLMKVQSVTHNFNFHEIAVSKTDNGSYYTVSAMLEDEDFILAGTEFADGLHVFDKKTGGHKTLAFGIAKNEDRFLLVRDIFKDRTGRIWVLTRDFLYRFNKTTGSLIKEKQPPDCLADKPSSSLYRIAEDNNGRLWIASGRNGLFCYDPTRKTYLHYTTALQGKQFIPSNTLQVVVKDARGRLWIGGNAGCLCYYDLLKQQFISVAPGQLKNNPGGNRISSLLSDKKGNIWAGTDAGLCCFNAKADVPVLQEIYTSQEGIKADLALDLCEDRFGRIWCITPTALCSINPANKQVNSFNETDGLFNADIGERLMASPDGQLRMSTFKGYYSFDPAVVQNKKINAPLSMISFTVNGTERYYQHELDEKNKITLTVNENVFAFEFAALDFVNSTREQYAYMLEGFDKEWIYSGNRRYASYTNIPGGDYTFRVKAGNMPQVWNEKTLAIPIHINRPFYQIWWVIVLGVFFLASAIYLFFRFRLKRQQQLMALQGKAQLLEKEKAMVMYESLKQQLNPHFLFNSLTSLSSLIQLDQKMAREFLDQMSRIYRYILKNRGNELIPLGEEIRFVQTYIKLQQTRFEEGLIVNIQVDPASYTRKVVPVTLQNLIENAIKHNIIDTDTPLIVDIYTAGAMLIVRNNLQVKKFVETSNKQGLANLQSLYQYLGGTPVQIISNNHYFTVTIPLL
jgi:ligand-binding sensor domain-containing protein